MIEKRAHSSASSTGFARRSCSSRVDTRGRGSGMSPRSYDESCFLATLQKQNLTPAHPDIPRFTAAVAKQGATFEQLMPKVNLKQAVTHLR
jgi:hypothetical protein